MAAAALNGLSLAVDAVVASHEYFEAVTVSSPCPCRGLHPQGAKIQAATCPATGLFPARS